MAWTSHLRVAFIAGFLLSSAPSLVASPPRCMDSHSDGNTIQISLPLDIALASTEIRWKLDGMEIEGEGGSAISLGLDIFASNSFQITASNKSGEELCTITIAPQAYVANTVPYSEISLGAPLVALSQLNASSNPYAFSLEDGKKSKDLEKKMKKIQKTKESYALSSSPDKEALSALQAPPTGSTIIVDTSQLWSAAKTQTSPTSSVPEKLSSTATSVEVHFVTEREPSSNPVEIFSAQRNPDRTLRYGVAYVTVPESRRRMFVSDPVYWSFRQSDFDAKFTPALSKDDFYKSVIGELSSHDPISKQLFVFIHGFNNGFVEDIYKTAELAHDSHFSGAAMMFDWPTKDGLLDYVHDRSQVDISKHDLADFLENLASNSGAGRINIIAHSMGVRLLVEAFDILSSKGRKFPSLGQVILAAPDVDQDRFAQVMAPLAASKTISRITLYGSRKDWAMWCSRRVNSGIEPIGALPPEIHVSGIDQIDASALPMNYIGHDYFVTTKPILNDIGILLQGQNNSLPRPGIVAVAGSSFGFWRFTKQP